MSSAAVGAAALLLTGCGTSSSSPAEQRSLELDWHETTGRADARLIVDVRRLVIRRNGWSVEAGVTNRTGVGLLIGRPHHTGGTEFGVLLVEDRSTDAIDKAGPGFFASTFRPALPSLLNPGQAWRGTFSGRGRLASGRFVRVELGRFTTVGGPRGGLPWRFRYITDHVRRLP